MQIYFTGRRYVAQFMLYTALFLSDCLSDVGVLSKQPNENNAAQVTW